MKCKIIFVSAFLLLAIGSTFAQSKNQPKSIINKSALIKKYHDQKELVEMQKGDLVTLCIERVAVLVKTIPYVALATKPGVTMSDLGIPNNPEYRKALESEEEATESYLEKTTEFQTKMLPYSDKDDLISAILFYESILKSLHELKEM